jgi:hypothetical protein
MKAFIVAAILCWSSALLVAAAPIARASEPAASCVSSVGPGIAPPASVPSGVSGFHTAWYGQSGYPTLCPGERSTATVAYYNSGSRGWIRGNMGETAFLGTSDPIPGQDQASLLGGDGQLGSPATGWPRYNRVAIQPADYVGPGQVAWFQFTIQAPNTPGTYRLYIRPLVEGATWMEDVGVYWQVTVKDAASVGSISVSPATAGAVDAGGSRSYIATVSGAGCVDLAIIDDASYPATADGGLADADGNGRADLSTAAVFTIVNGTGNGTSYVHCVTPSTDQTVRFVLSSTTPNTTVRPLVFRDDNNNSALDVSATFVPSEPWGLGGAVRFLPPPAVTGASTVSVFAFSSVEKYFTDAGAVATYRYDSNDTFQRYGIAISLAQFEQVISVGDVISVSYQADPAATSIFNVTADLGRNAPTVDANVDSWDGGPTQNDAGLRIAEPATNVNGIAYSVQRSSTGGGAQCGPGTGAYADLAVIMIPSFSNSTTYIDRNLGVGAYCYRVGVADAVTGVVTFAYSQGVVVNNPPLPIALPRSLHARVTTSAGNPALLDTGDVIKIVFDKAMASPVGGQMRVQDNDGTTADIWCRQLEQICTLNPAPETLGGIVYAANTVITIAIRVEPRVVAAGSNPGLQLNVTVTSSTFTDIAGNLWNIPGSDDVVLGAPD